MLSSSNEYTYYINELKKYQLSKIKHKLNRMNQSLNFNNDKLKTTEKNLNIIDGYYNMLKFFYSEQNNFHQKNYCQCIDYLEKIYIQIDFLNKIDKKYRLHNMNKLIELISKKAAGINDDIELVDILTKEIKLSNLLLEEYKEILEEDKNNLNLIITKIEDLSSKINNI